MADVGCLEGGYSAGFARLGYQVLGLEVRDDNFAACRYVQVHTNLPNLTFVQDDAWNLARYGPFDAVFCCGLLYHLDRPRQFLGLLADVTSRMVVLDTHVAPDRTSLQPMLPRAVRVPLARLLARYDRGGSLSRYVLSRMTRHEGVEGRWYLEFPSDDAFRARATARWASWNNRRSFWPRKEHSPALHEGGSNGAGDLDFSSLESTKRPARVRQSADRCMFVGHQEHSQEREWPWSSG